MELPWTKIRKLKSEKEGLELEIEKLEQERDNYKEKLEAEEERRSELARKKQEAEEKLNRLQDRLENLGETKEDPKSDEKYRWERPEFNNLKKTLKKLESVESPEEDLITIFSKDKPEKIPDRKGLKNSLNAENYSRISSEEKFIAFMDGEIFDIILKTRPFFQNQWLLDNEFHAEDILEFIESEKYWGLVSTGETLIFEEQDGYFTEVERLKTRVENKQKKGGYSQDRFENKREEQLQEHIERTRKVLENLENVKLLGNHKLCKELPGEYLGGYDSSREPGPGLFYDFRLKRYG
ncbi:MAG: Vms1/Ankzf1 family peptidyl-tRNA hydrolase [Candidatus Nanosalina sp.]